MTTDTLSLTFAALADPTRRAILEKLARGISTVTDLAAPFNISLPAISRHLKVLERAGLISREKNAQWRMCSLRADPLENAAEWVGQYRMFWEDQFDALAAFLETDEDDDNAK